LVLEGITLEIKIKTCRRLKGAEPRARANAHTILMIVCIIRVTYLKYRIAINKLKL